VRSESWIGLVLVTDQPRPHIGVDAESGLAHTVIGTAANVHGVNSAQALLHGEEADVYAVAGHQGISGGERRTQFAGTSR
jgi:IS5 family transposase